MCDLGPCLRTVVFDGKKLSAHVIAIFPVAEINVLSGLEVLKFIQRLDPIIAFQDDATANQVRHGVNESVIANDRELRRQWHYEQESGRANTETRASQFLRCESVRENRRIVRNDEVQVRP